MRQKQTARPENRAAGEFSAIQRTSRAVPQKRNLKMRFAAQIQGRLWVPEQKYLQ
jgi:hypothetical protein